ncbi:MAG: Gfo/Idh/MocA family oxidoreductase [Candidatus Riflebacteria bacterium]|nr:Gfo/Idh/MocA family oxidoreductase [Candidatus Riflebacteria bacterium]
MKILVGGKWTDGFIEYFRAENDYRIEVQAIKNLEKIEKMYFVRPKSLKLVMNYFFEVGLVHLLRKIKSRMGEKLRNEKFISIGIGTIIDSPKKSEKKVGDYVLFIATCHPPAFERIVLPGFLLSPWTKMLPFNRLDGEIKYLPVNSSSNSYWNGLQGFSAFSGCEIPSTVVEKCFEKAESDLLSSDWCQAKRLSFSKSSILETRPASEKSQKALSESKPSGIVFGLGNYAKSFLIPNVSPFVKVKTIHEIDPTQVPIEDRTLNWDSSPFPRNKEKADAFFIASYHHTHVPIALEALECGAYAVVEKPIAVDNNQLDALLNSLQRSGPKLFSCFHKRYQHFNKMIVEDFGNPGRPISFHCIVFEVPLPQLHWYWWPNSKSRLVSNGCHWIDYFLFLNGFSKPIFHDLFIGKDGTINASAELENGAVFSMLLTDRGSQRIGLRDYIELRSFEKTAMIRDGGEYIAEDGFKVIRRAKVNKLSSYENMYAQIAEKIAKGMPGDSVESLKVSAGLILEFEKDYVNHSKRIMANS